MMKKVIWNRIMKSAGFWSSAMMFGLMMTVSAGCRSQQESIALSGSLTGILFVTGNEPFTDISLQTVNGRMHVIQKDTSALYSALRGLQGKKVRILFRLPDAKRDSTLIIVQHYDLVTER